MTIPFVSSDPIVHRRRATRRDDAEPRISDMLDDPVVQALMAVDGVARSEIESLIRRLRRGRGLPDRPTFEAELFAECSA